MSNQKHSLIIAFLIAGTFSTGNAQVNFSRKFSVDSLRALTLQSIRVLERMNFNKQIYADTLSSNTPSQRIYIPDSVDITGYLRLNNLEALSGDMVAIRDTTRTSFPMGIGSLTRTIDSTLTVFLPGSSTEYGGIHARGGVFSGGLSALSLNLGSGTITSGLINGQTISSAANFTGTITSASYMFANVSGASDNAWGFIADVQSASASLSSKAFKGGQFTATSNVTGGTNSRAVGLNLIASHAGSSTLSRLSGLEIAWGSAGSAVTTSHGIFLQETGNLGGTNYGIFIDDVTSGTTDYSIYTGLGDNSFGDDLTLRAGHMTVSAGYLDADSLRLNGSTVFAPTYNAGLSAWAGGNGDVGTFNVRGTLGVTGATTLSTTLVVTGDVRSGLRVSNLSGAGVTAATSSTSLDAFSNNGINLIITNTFTDATAKLGGIAVRHYTNAEEEVRLIGGASGVTNNDVNYGGGTSLLNTATRHLWYTAANNTTVTGTVRAILDETGGVGRFTLGSTAGTGTGNFFALNGTFAGNLTVTGDAEVQDRLLKTKGADAASGSTVTLGDGNYFDITGTTAIDYITTTGWTAGSTVILQFDGSVTVNHNTGSVPANTAAILLAGAANFGATANDVLMLVYDGVTWREVSRTVI